MDDRQLQFYHEKAVSMCEKYSDVLDQIIDYTTISSIYSRDESGERYIVGRELIHDLEWLKTVELTELIECEEEENHQNEIYARYEVLAIYMGQLPDCYSYAREYRDPDHDTTITIQQFHKALFLYMTKEEQIQMIDNYINMVYFIINVLDEMAFDIKSSFDYGCFHGIPLEMEGSLCV